MPTKNVIVVGANPILGDDVAGATLVAGTTADWNPTVTPRRDAKKIADWLFAHVPGMTFEALRTLMAVDPRYRI